MKLPQRRTVRKWVLIGLPILLLCYILGSVCCAYAFTTSSNRSLGLYTPADYGLKTYENVSFPSASTNPLTLRGWWIPRKNAQRVLIVVHVKNGTRAFGLEVAHQLWAADFNLLLFDLRGHGQSDGDHFSYGAYEQQDVVGATKFVESKGFAPASIGVLGWSLGAASSLLAMGQTQDIRAAVIDSAYGDFGRLAQERLGPLIVTYPGISLAAHLLYGVDTDSIKPEAAFAHFGNRHIFVIQGDQDMIVPVQEAYHIQQAGSSSISDFWIVAGANHAQAYHTQPAEYTRRVIAFFNRELS